ncbi:hypothetical protein EDD85DRAFT_792776 [Armillaria nabsnona]|nr:hypothetical protein EDD85DRAFT_792776 [Armillaria nabsnona]
MDTVSPNSILAHYLDVLKEANYTTTFDRVIEMILRHCNIATTIHNANIIHTIEEGMDHYSLSPELIHALCNATEIFFCILMHAIHNVPYHSVATLLMIPPPQVLELGLDNPDNIKIRYYHLYAYRLERVWYNKEAQLHSDLTEYLAGIRRGYVWMDKRIDQTCFYPERVKQIAEDRGMTMEELLTHYKVNDTGAISTFIPPNNVMVLYDPHYPGFQSVGPPVAPSPPNSPSPPNTPIAFNDDLPLPNEDNCDICLSDYSDSEDSEMTDSSSSGETDMKLFLDSDDSFTNSLISVMVTNGYSDEVDVIMEDHRHIPGIQAERGREGLILLSGHWLTIVCYNDKGKEVGWKSFDLEELQQPDIILVSNMFLLDELHFEKMKRAEAIKVRSKQWCLQRMGNVLVKALKAKLHGSQPYPGDTTGLCFMSWRVLGKAAGHVQPHTSLSEHGLPLDGTSIRYCGLKVLDKTLPIKYLTNLNFDLLSWYRKKLNQAYETLLQWLQGPVEYEFLTHLFSQSTEMISFEKELGSVVAVADSYLHLMDSNLHWEEWNGYTHVMSIAGVQIKPKTYLGIQQHASVVKTYLPTLIPLHLTVQGSHSKILCGPKVQFKYQSIKMKHYFDITNLSGYDLVLSTPWLYQHNVCVCFNRSSIEIGSDTSLPMVGDNVSQIQSQAMMVSEDALKQVHTELQEYMAPICKTALETPLPPLWAINHTILLIDKHKVYPWRPSWCPEAFCLQWDQK